MDNVTHTLIGALLGEVAARMTPGIRSNLAPSTRRNLCVTLAAIGSNLPDSDLLYSFLGGKVNYLLHHRGHTHTIVFALLLGAFTYALTLWWCRRRGLRPSRPDQWLLAGVLAFTPLLHILMDFSNNYGVHPFWPLDNRWFYGDSVFIIEPLLWAACAPLTFLFRTAIARSLVAALLVVAIGLCFGSGLVPMPIALAYVVVVATMLLIAWRARPNQALLAGVALWLGTTSMFVLTANTARARIAEIAATQFPGSQLLDRIVTPLPTNPVCWDVILVQRAHETFVLRRAMLSLAPTLLAADQCPSLRLGGRISAPLTAVALPNTEQLTWYGQIESSLAQLDAAAKSNCEAAGALRFMRAPWLAKVGDAEVVLGDLRYDREPELGFAEIPLIHPPRCPPLVPPWIEPRQDLRELADR